MEKFELVDKDGKNTGKIVTLEELEDVNTRKFPEGHYLPVAGIVVLNENNEVLLEKRSMKKISGAGKWGICAGKVDFGESVKEAAVREASEEIGIKFDKDSLKPLATSIIKDGRYSIYYVKTDIPINKYKIQESELEEVKYFKIEEIEKLENSIFDWTDNVKELLKNEA